jgi:hypothetical protein
MANLFDSAQQNAAAFGANLIIHSEIARLLNIADDYLARSLDTDVSDDDRAALQSASWEASKQVADLGTVLGADGISA